MIAFPIKEREIHFFPAKEPNLEKRRELTYFIGEIVSKYLEKAEGEYPRLRFVQQNPLKFVHVEENLVLKNGYEIGPRQYFLPIAEIDRVENGEKELVVVHAIGRVYQIETDEKRLISISTQNLTRSSNDLGTIFYPGEEIIRAPYFLNVFRSGITYGMNPHFGASRIQIDPKIKEIDISNTPWHELRSLAGILQFQWRRNPKSLFEKYCLMSSRARNERGDPAG